MKKRGFNMVVIDVGDGIEYASHPEIAVKNAWSHDKLKSELKKCRDMGLEPIPKLNFSTCHDQWMGKYARMVSTPEYYKVCEDLIAEAIDLFDKPRFFHLGMDEEEAIHQPHFEYAVMRQHGLWWRDIKFLFKQVRSQRRRARGSGATTSGTTRTMFYKNMPKNVLQSNWYRDPVRGDAKSVYGGVFNMDIECVRTFVEVDKAGYDQIPTVSNWETPENIYGTIRFCREHRLEGAAEGLPAHALAADAGGDARPAHGRDRAFRAGDGGEEVTLSLARYSELTRVRRLAPSPRYSGERAGERGERRSTSSTRSIHRPATELESIGVRLHAHLAPLPCPLPGVPGRGRRYSSNPGGARG